MKNTTLLLLAVLLAAARATAAEFYVEPRVSAFFLGGTPGVGDLGVEEESDTPSAAFTFAAGARLTPKIALEVRFTPLGDFDLRKVAPDSRIFPSPGPILPATVPYRYLQSTRFFTVALPVRLAQRERWSVDVTPLLLIERTSVELHHLNAVYVTVPGPFWSRDETTVRPGAELGVTCRLGDTADFTLGYTYAALETADAHLLNAGLRFRF